MEERNKNKKENSIFMPFIILLGVMGTCLIFLGIGIVSKQNEIDQIVDQRETAVEEETVSEETEIELSDTRKKLEKLLEEQGHKKITESQYFLLFTSYNLPLFEDSPREYSFDERMDLYLTRLEKIVKTKGQWDILYSAISVSVSICYDSEKEQLSEEHCERFLAIIKLAKKRLKTALVWGEEPAKEEKKETKTLKLTKARKKLEVICEERGHHNPRSEKEIDFLLDNYNIPDFYFSTDADESTFEKKYDKYLEKMEKLAKKKGEWDLLYDDISDSLIWDYDDYRELITEEQCERVLAVIKLCKKRKNTAKIF